MVKIFGRIVLASAVAALMLAAAPARAGMYDLVTANPATQGDLGTSHTYNFGSVSITASGFLTAGGKTNLWGKNGGGDETGLGLKSDPNGGSSSQHEIFQGAFIQLHMSGDTINGLSLGSSQKGENFAIYGTNTSGSLVGADLLVGPKSGDGFYSLPTASQYLYIDIAAVNPTGTDHSNVLLDSVSAAPEPASLTLFGLGGFGLLGFGLRKRKKS